MKRAFVLAAALAQEQPVARKYELMKLSVLLIFSIKNRRTDRQTCFNQTTMIKPTNPGRRFAGALLPAIVLAVGSAWAGPVYTIQDSGAPRQFEIADDEVSLSRKGADLAKDVKSTLGDAVIVKDFGNRVVVRFPQGGWKKAMGARAVGGTEVEPVMYEQGQSRKDTSRRIVTAQVLAAGADQAELVKVSGATSAKATSVNGYMMLDFASATDALLGTEKLRKGGLKAEPQLRKQANKRAVLNDIFFSEQWHLQNIGQGNGVPGTDINPLLAWDFFKGRGVTLAIVDDGVDLAHEDLAGNVIPQGVNGPHHNFNDGDPNDPSPGFGDAHGTSCAGVAAARGNNGLGVSGGGPEASLLGLRLVSGAFTDADENGAFTWAGGGEPTVIDISSNSWGPFDDVRLEGPGILSLDGLKTATISGRAGKGVVFCWAGGNGRANSDNVNMDGYANSRYVVAVGAIGNNAKQAFYSESGSPLLISAPSNGGQLGIFTTDVSGGGGYNDGFTFGEPGDANYTNSFGGTSSAAPLVAGVVSLILEANPALGYRDVMEILTTTAAKVDPSNIGWATNGAGFLFNHGYGGGMADATKAVIRAQDWVNLSPETQLERILSTPAVPVAIPDGDANGVSRDFNFTATNLRVEHVEVQLDIAHSHRSDLAITIKSPSGHVSRLIEKRAHPTNGNSDVDYTDGNLGWIFSTTQHWGEESAGTWTVNINDTQAGTAGTLRKARVRLFGTPSTSSTRFTFDKRIDFVSERAGTLSALVRRKGSLTGAATLDYFVSTTTDATAATVGVNPPDGDFSPVSGTLTFASGEEVKSISVPIYDDPTTEGDEHFYIVLTNPSVGTLGGVSVQTVEIDDDEGNSVSVVATDPTATERNLATEIADNGVFTISRKLPAVTPLTVTFTLTQPAPGPIASGTPNYATHVLDYFEIPLSATIPANATSIDVVIEPRNDRLSEGTEIVELALIPDASFNLGVPNKASINLLDNDLVPVSVSSSVASVLENSPEDIVFTITRDTPLIDSPLNIFLEPSGTARPGVDYDPPFPAVVTIPPGKATTTVTIHANDNSEFNPVKTIILGVSQGLEYKEGFFRTAEVRIFDNEPAPDAIKPTITIAAPVKKTRINHPDTITASGNATDNPDSLSNTNVAQVQFRINRGAWNVATLTNNDWSADITTHSALGSNLLEVFAIDEAGNESKISGVEFTYVKPRNLTTTVVGPGSIPPAFTGVQALEVGTSYTIIAKPSTGDNLFNGWSGYYTATTKALSFIMPDEDIALTATFSPALLEDGAVGRFTGLVSRDSKVFDSATSGFLDATVTKTGRMSAKLTYGGVRYSIRGEVTAAGQYLGEVARKNNTPLAITLLFDPNILGTKRLTGTVSADGIDSAIDCPKVLTKEEALVVTNGIVGKYTFQMPMEDLITQSKPQGTGVATLTVDAKGGIRWKGALPDGTPATQAAFLSQDKTWPLFLSLHEGRGVMLGTITHDNTQTLTDLTGSFNWQKIGAPRDRFFPNGFTIYSSQVSGSAYLPPASGQRVLTSFGGGTGSLILEEGNFVNAFPAKSIGITDQNKAIIAPTGADKLELRFATTTGALTGNFIHPVTFQKTKIAGVVLQKTQRAAGVFVGSTQSNTAIQTGRLAITPPAVVP